MKRNYIITNSGRLVSPDEGVPSIEDIALSLSRQPRFGGMTRRWWSVLDHSLFVEHLARIEGQSPATRLACLLHDAHEFTGDIPTHFKTGEQRELQAKLDKRIAAEFGVRHDDLLDKRVAKYDHRALLAEAEVVGPPMLVDAQAVHEHFGAVATASDVELLRRAFAERVVGSSPAQLYLQLGARNVRRFLAQYNQLTKEMRCSS